MFQIPAVWLRYHPHVFTSLAVAILINLDPDRKFEPDPSKCIKPSSTTQQLAGLLDQLSEELNSAANVSCMSARSLGEGTLPRES